MRPLRRIGSSILTYVIAFVIVAIWLIPVFWMVLNSFKSTQSIIQADLSILFKPTLEHYRYIFSRQDFLHYARNSVIVSLSTTILAMTIGTLAAYSISRFGTGGRGFELWVLLTRMAPPAVLIIPFFIIFRSMGLINTLWSLVIADTTFTLSFVIWTMRGFIDEVPVDLELAALLDGCSRLQSFFKIVLPVTRPGVVATTIFSLIFAWNEYLFALTLATASRSKTLPVAAGDFVTGYAINWGPIFASGTLIMLPVFIVVLFMQKYIVRGLTMGAVK